MGARGSWEDLSARVITGVAMAVAGLGAIALGGTVFAVFGAAVSAGLVWELARILKPGAGPRLPLLMAGLGGLAVLAAWVMPSGAAGPLFAVLALAGAAVMPRLPERVLFFGFALAMLSVGHGLAVWREGQGIVWMFWLVLVVVATDVAGYFAGRFIGGPRFWPRISPKKTWSGTVAGWLAAALVGLAFMLGSAAGPGLVGLSVALSFASQIGDMAESALKRRASIKDSSSLLPGHGGLFDRFDGLLGAAVFLLLLAQLVPLPEVRF